MSRCLRMEKFMVTGNLKKMVALVCTLCLVCANVLVVYANEQGRKEEETLNAQNDGITTPPTSESYTKYTFKISLPTCIGSGEYKLSRQYFDPVLQYGYPASMKFSMSTSGTCDFGAFLSAEDNFGTFYDMSGGSHQSNGMFVEKKVLYGDVILKAVNTAKHPSKAWVCDDEDYGEIYNIQIEKK